MSDGRPPIPLEPTDDGPLWESDIDEREARRRKLLFFGGSAVAVLVGFGVLYAGLSWLAGSLTEDPSDPQAGTIILEGQEEGEASSVPASAEPSAPVAPSDLDWYAIEAPLGNSRRLFATEAGTLYALSTIPGQAVNWPPPPALYKSTDGENWEMIPLDDSNSATDLAAGGTSLYLIGTAPDGGRFTEPQQIAVSASHDEGATWTTSVLPSVAAPPGDAPIEWSQLNTRIAATDSTVIAVANSQFFLDYRLIVPAEFAGDFEYRSMPDGVSVIDHRQLEQAYMACEKEMPIAGDDFANMSEECQALFAGNDESIASIAFFTWEELNLPGGGSPLFSELFVSEDEGATFQAIQSPFAAGSEVTGLVAVPDGFVATENLQGRITIWRSPDGRSWQQAGALPDFDWVNNVGAYNDDVVVVGQGPQGSSIAWEAEDGGWSVLDVDELLGPALPGGERWLSSAAVGPLGVVAVFQGFDPVTEREIAQAAVGTSPEDWSLVPIGEITGMAGGYSDWAVVGRDQIIIRYQVHGRQGPLSLQVMGVRTS